MICIGLRFFAAIFQKTGQCGSRPRVANTLRLLGHTLEMMLRYCRRRLMDKVSRSGDHCLLQMTSPQVDW